MSRSPANAADRARLRSINSLYRLNGWDMIVHVGGSARPSQRGLMSVHELEEDSAGSAVEASFQGYALRLRRGSFADGVLPDAGDRIVLDIPFEGHTHFDIVAPAKSWNRSGLQIAYSITPGVDPDVVVSPAHVGLNIA